MPAMGGGGTGVTGGAGEIASFGDFDEGETAVLFVIGADAAVIGAAMDGGGMWFPGVFAGLVVIPDVFVIFDIRGDHHFLKAMFLAGLGEIDLTFFEDDLRADLFVANDAETYGMVVIDIVAGIFHMVFL